MSIPAPPDYVVDNLVSPDPNGPAQYLADGAWCGHGEPLFNVYDVQDRGSREFALVLPATPEGEEMIPPAVKLTNADGTRSFLLYDPRKHPANLFAWDKYAKVEPRFAEPLACQQCQGKIFRAAVGFEVPSDSSSPNDTSWFALSAICVGCGAAGIVFDDETA
jgi:hypothetical protein